MKKKKKKKCIVIRLADLLEKILSKIVNYLKDKHWWIAIIVAIILITDLVGR